MAASTADSSHSILSLSSDALIRVFSYLALPSVDDEVLLHPPFAPILSNNPDSPAASLGQTCRRLHILYHCAVRLVSVQYTCACGAPPSLAAFPFAGAAVLDETLVALPMCADPQSLSRLRALCVSSFPSDEYGQDLATAVPNLRELSLGCFRWFSLRKNVLRVPGSWNSGTVPNPLLPDFQRGFRSFILHLPSSLRRLSVVGLFDETQRASLWDSVSQLEQLEDLNVCMSKDLAGHALTSAMVKAIRNCNRLRRLSVWDSHLELELLLPELPARLTTLMISSRGAEVDDFLYVNAPPLAEEAMVQGLQTLQLSGGSPCLQNWALLLPVASQLRKIHIHRIMDRSLLNVDYDVPLFPRLEELHLLGRSSFLNWGLKEELLWKLLASAGVLRELRVRIGDSSSSLTGKGLARALTAATSGLTLKCLKLDLVTRLKMPEQFESAASVIGLKFSLEKLDLSNTLLTPVCLASIGRGCPLLWSLKLGNESRSSRNCGFEHGEDEAAKVGHLATEIGSHFPLLTYLDLSGSDISSEGLALIGRGCLRLKYLSLARCAKVDDAVVMVLWNTFPALSKLDLFETLVSESGLKTIGELWQQSHELSYLEIGACSSSFSESLVAQLNVQFPRLNFVLGCSLAAAEFFI